MESELASTGPDFALGPTALLIFLSDAQTAQAFDERENSKNLSMKITAQT
jgi:hypothetical protein